MNDNDKPITPLIDYLFWSLLILFTNPGGVVEAFNAHYIIGKIQINDLLFFLLSICYVFIPKGFNDLDTDFKKITLFLFIYLFYYFTFHTFIVPTLNGNRHDSLFMSLIKSRHTLYYIFIFIYIYEFFKRRVDVFLKIFTYSSVAILMIFLLQLLINVNILPVFSLNRSFIDINRNLMLSDGLIPLLIPLGVVILIFKLNIKYKYLILLGFALLPIYFSVSLIRREIISIIIYFFIAILIKAYLFNQYKVIISSAVKVLLILIFLVVSSYFIFPKYVEATRISLIETYNVIQTGKTSTGERDERLGLNRGFIVKQFLKYPVLGTGFDSRWRGTGEEQGYEAADYPLLAAFARYGIVGIILFLSVYFFIIKILKTDLLFLRNQKNENSTLLFLLLMTFILYFSFHLLQYFNWFCAFASNAFYFWYFYLAFYLATRYKFYFVLSQNGILHSPDVFNLNVKSARSPN